MHVTRGQCASALHNVSSALYTALHGSWELAEQASTCIATPWCCIAVQAWRCEACECWVPRAAGGETAWRAHVQGIRHRRQALSLLHTGARGTLLLSAFESLPGARLGPVPRNIWPRCRMLEHWPAWLMEFDSCSSRIASSPEKQHTAMVLIAFQVCSAC